MDRSGSPLVLINQLAGLLLAATMLVSAGGCPALLATGIYVWEGGNLVPAECDALRDERVVVMCRPPSSHEYRHAGASRTIAQRVSELLVKNVKDIDVVNPREVDNWVDESDWGDFRELAEAVQADLVVHVELDDFELLQRQDAVSRPRGCDRERVRHAQQQPSWCGSGSWAKCLPGEQRHSRRRTSRCSSSSASLSRLSRSRSP